MSNKIPFAKCMSLFYDFIAMIISFVRSGESEDEVLNRHQRDSTQLSLLGEKEVLLLSRNLMFQKFDYVLSSPLERAKQTVEILAGASSEIIFDQNLSEIREPSELVGELKNDPAFATTRYLLKSKWSYPAWRFSDEENFQDVKRRAESVIKNLIKNYDSSVNQENKKLLIVSHERFLTMLFLVMTLGKSVTAKEYQQFILTTALPHSSLTICTYVNSTWKMNVFADLKHLEKNDEYLPYL